MVFFFFSECCRRTIQDGELALGALPPKHAEAAERVLKGLRGTGVADEAALNTAVRAAVLAHARKCWGGPRATPRCGNSPLFDGAARALLARLGARDEQQQTLEQALTKIVASGPNAGPLLAANGVCLRTSPSTYRDKTGGYAGEGRQLVSKV